MTPAKSPDSFLDAIADQIADRVYARLAEKLGSSGKAQPLAYTISEVAATLKLGVSTVKEMGNGKEPGVARCQKRLADPDSSASRYRPAGKSCRITVAGLYLWRVSKWFGNGIWVRHALPTWKEGYLVLPSLGGRETVWPVLVRLHQPQGCTTRIRQTDREACPG
jgi:hypothetical protein